MTDHHTAAEILGQSQSVPGVVDGSAVRGRAFLTRSRVLTWLARYGKRLAQLAILITLASGLYFYVSAPQSVDYVVVRAVKTDETIGATGKIRGWRVAELGVDVPGIVKQIYVREGDWVAAGQTIASLDKSELLAAAQAAADAVIGAEAELAKVKRGPLPSEIRQARAELAQAESVGHARIAQAEARLRELLAGTRKQELKVAEAELRRSQELLSKAEIEYRRAERLVQMGAMAQANLDQARTDLETARADVAARQQHLSLLLEGPRAEQIAEAEATLAEAKASRQTSVSAARERLNTYLALPRREDVIAAQARLNRSRSELRRAWDLVAKCDIRAPFAGLVADIRVECGQSISPGQPIIVLHEMSRPVVEVETDEENLAVLAIGQRAVISSDSFPGRSFEAEVIELGSRVDPERGTVLIKLRPLVTPSWVRPDQTVDVNVITRRNSRRIILPADALTKHEGYAAVWVARGGKAVPVRVSTGPVGPSGVAVSGNLKQGDKVIRNASNVVAFGDVSLKRSRRLLR